MPKFKFNTEMLMAGAAMVTAVAAVVVAMIQTDIMREEAEMERQHARISVMPSIMMMYSNGFNVDGERYLELNIRNMGLGPAVIEEFAIEYRGEKLENQRAWVHAVASDLEESGEKLEGVGISNSFVGPGLVIPAEQGARPIRVEHILLAPALQQAFKHTKFSVCACSVYGDCQRVTGLAQRPENVTSCKKAED